MVEHTPPKDKLSADDKGRLKKIQGRLSRMMEVSPTPWYGALDGEVIGDVREVICHETYVETRMGPDSFVLCRLDEDDFMRYDEPEDGLDEDQHDDLLIQQATRRYATTHSFLTNSARDITWLLGLIHQLANTEEAAR